MDEFEALLREERPVFYDRILPRWAEDGTATGRGWYVMSVAEDRDVDAHLDHIAALIRAGHFTTAQRNLDHVLRVYGDFPDHTGMQSRLDTLRLLSEEGPE